MENARYKVLLIEDDKIDQKAFVQLVKAEGLSYDYTIAGSASDARNILACQHFDIVISDYLLGDGTALDILASVKNTPVIVITGIGNEEIAVKAWRAGAYDYLTKDINRSYLKAVPIAIENAIRYKRAEEDLRLLSGAIMSTVDSVYITDMEGKITFVNKAFCDTYGYKKEEILGKDSGTLWLVGPKTNNSRTVFQTQSIGGSSEIAFYHRRKDGSMFPVSLSRSIIKDSTGNKIAAVGTARNITEHVLAEDALRRTNSKLKEQDKLKSEFAFRISETLKSLLAYGDMADGPEIGEVFWNNLDKARKIIDNFLIISQIDADKMEFNLAEFSLNEVIAEVVKTLSPFAEGKDVGLESITPDSEIIIRGDRDRIIQAMMNLINNSITSAAASSHVEVHLRDFGSEAVLEIRGDSHDKECCKPDKILDCIDCMKKQPDWSAKQVCVFGLSAAKKIVEMHGGWIWIESTDTAFGKNLCVSLPKPGVREGFSVAAKDSHSVQHAEDSG
jgi:PAS domain S-box-containing protein